MKFTHRIFGLENEFGTIAEYPNGTMSDTMDRTFDDLIRLRQIENSVFANDLPGNNDRVWHANGGCTYIDRGNHPEHATPECLSIRDVVRYNKAGEQLCRIMFDRHQPKDIRFLLFKNNLGYDTESQTSGASGQFGCHENYLIRTERSKPLDILKKMQIFEPILPFLATRQLFDGSGWWDINGNFHLSQRASSIRKNFGLSAIAERPFMQLKTDDTESDMRLHIIVGDANICEFAIYLKMGTTALVLDLFESGCCPDVGCINPIEALHTLSDTGDSRIPLFQTHDGSRMSAFDIQTVFLEAVQTQLTSASFTNNRVEDEVKTIVLYWEQALNAIFRNDTEWMRGRIDYATKQYLAEKEIARKMRNPSEMILLRKNIDILYHGISNTALEDRMNAAWPDRRIVNNDDIADALMNPPADTRAAMRGKFVQTLAANGIKRVSFMNWCRMAFYQQVAPYRECFFEIPSGFISDMPEFETFLSCIKQTNPS